MFDVELFQKKVETIYTAKHDIQIAMGSICGMLNELLFLLPEQVYSADDGTVFINGFYVDEEGRLRYETEVERN
jgi:hypothetical protein